MNIFLLSIDVRSLFFFSAEGDSHGKDARQCKPAGLSRFLFGVPEQAESQQLQQRQPVSGHGPGGPQRQLPRQCGEEQGGLLQGGRALLLQLLKQARGRSRGLPQRFAVRQLLLLHQSGLQRCVGATSSEDRAVALESSLCPESQVFRHFGHVKFVAIHKFAFIFKTSLLNLKNLSMH